MAQLPPEYYQADARISRAIDVWKQELDETGKYYADLQASEEKKKKVWEDRKIAMDVAREIADVGELINGLEAGIDDQYLRGAYYCRLVELQPALSPVGRLIAERYVEKFKEIV
jgi:hypothetical protein